MYKIFCFWFGTEMNPNRKSSYESIKNNSECDVVLVTDNNLKDYEIHESPFHDGFKYLSLTHKSDYLRSYFMYHYGGGYTDIKHCDYSWRRYFDQLHNSDKDFIGYREINGGVATSHEDSFIRPYYDELCGNGHYIFKQKTDLSKIWLNETKNKMDEVYEKLRVYPGHYHSRAVFGGVHGDENFITDIDKEKYNYPLGWNELLGRILHKIMFNNRDRFLIGMPLPDMSNYR